MGVATYQNVNIQLPLDRGESFHVSPWNHLVSVYQANFEVANLNNFGFRKLRILIEVSAHDVAHALGGSQILKPLDGLT